MVPPYELGREMGSEMVEVTQATLTRDAAKKWRADAVEAGGSLRASTLPALNPLLLLPSLCTSL